MDSVGKDHAQTVSGGDAGGYGELQVVGKHPAGLKVDGGVAGAVAVADADASHLFVGMKPTELERVLHNIVGVEEVAVGVAIPRIAQGVVEYEPRAEAVSELKTYFGLHHGFPTEVVGVLLHLRSHVGEETCLWQQSTAFEEQQLGTHGGTEAGGVVEVDGVECGVSAGQVEGEFGAVAYAEA